jgi:hypothetical protein
MENKTLFSRLKGSLMVAEDAKPKKPKKKKKLPVEIHAFLKA